MLLLFPLCDSIMRFNLHGISVQFRIYMASFHIHLALFARVWTCALPLTGMAIQVSSSHQEGESCLLQVREIQLSMGGSWEVPRNNSFTVVAEAEACSDQSCVVKAHKDRDLPGSSWYRKDRQDPQSLQQFHREQPFRFAWTWSTPVRIPVLAAGEELLPNVHYDSNHFAIGLSPWHDLCISNSISCQFQVGRCFLWECCGDCKCFGLGYCGRAESAFIRCSFHRTSEIASEWVMENRWSKKGERLKMELPVSYHSVTHHTGEVFFLFIAESIVHITLYQMSLFCILMQSISCLKMESITVHVFTQPEEPAWLPSIFHQPSAPRGLQHFALPAVKGSSTAKATTQEKHTDRWSSLDLTSPGSLGLIPLILGGIWMLFSAARHQLMFNLPATGLM